MPLQRLHPQRGAGLRHSRSGRPSLRRLAETAGTLVPGAPASFRVESPSADVLMIWNRLLCTNIVSERRKIKQWLLAVRPGGNGSGTAI